MRRGAVRDASRKVEVCCYSGGNKSSDVVIGAVVAR